MLDIYLKFTRVLGNPGFQLRMWEHKREFFISLSCGCTFEKKLAGEDHTECLFWLTYIYGGEFIDSEDSYWTDLDLDDTPHVFCEKDEHQLTRIDELVKLRRNVMLERPNDTAYEIGDDATTKVMYKLFFSGPGVTIGGAFFQVLLAPINEDVVTFDLEKAEAMRESQRSSNELLKRINEDQDRDDSNQTLEESSSNDE